MALFTPIKMADLGEAKNRVALAPLTRARATADGVVGDHHVEYYVQRSNAGVIISEGSFVSPNAVGFFCAPGIWSPEQTEAWKPVCKAVQAAGSIFVMQLWHCGRSSHRDFHGGVPQYAASPISLTKGGIYVPPKAEKKPYEEPRELKVEEIPQLLNEYRTAAANAKAAGVDGIEIHNANGYLLDGFLQSVTNKRTDKYGGSLENRLRLTSEVLDAVFEVFPPGRVGIRFSPNGVHNDMGSPDYIETFNAAIELCARKKVGYIHILDGVSLGFHKLGERYSLKMALAAIENVQGKDRVTMLMGNAGHTKESGEKEIEAGNADMISYGRRYMDNPDLVRRFREGIKLTVAPNTDHWYTPLAKDPRQGYTTFEAAP